MTDPGQLLPWDSEFFGKRIARVTASRLTPEFGAAFTHWADTHAIDCAYFLADAADAATLRLAPRYGFDLVDIRVTLGAVTAVGDVPAGSIAVRPATHQDVGTLQQIARTSHHDTRFYADGRFGRDRCDELYATWITKSCNGDADVVLVPEIEGRPAGYIAGHVGSDGTGTIGLTAVDVRARGRGCGRALVASALAWFSRRGIAHVGVVTQGRNTAALTLYQRCGFSVTQLALWHHRWSDAERTR